jgi:invasion protein IalB
MRAILTRLTLLAGLALAPATQATAQSSSAPDALRESFRDWTVQCQQIEGEGRACEMVQQVSHGESQQRIMLVSLRLDENDRLVGVIVTPFGLRLSEGVQILVGETAIARYGFDTCLAEGCFVIAAFGEKEIDAMRAGIDGQVTMMARGGNAVGLPLSFLGFSAALARLGELNAQQ